VPWLGWTCGTCRFCLSGRENLCLYARFTGFDIDGGYAEVAVADERFCFPIPDAFSDIEAAPLLCGGMIGFRALNIAGEGERLGLYGFGSSAHILCQIAAAGGSSRSQTGDEGASASRSRLEPNGRRFRNRPRTAIRGDHLRSVGP
jgi:propanol-preferring alcohol dehydrogenase